MDVSLDKEVPTKFWGSRARIGTPPLRIRAGFASAEVYALRMLLLVARRGECQHPAVDDCDEPVDIRRAG